MIQTISVQRYIPQALEMPEIITEYHNLIIEQLGEKTKSLNEQAQHDNAL